jgi:transcriptional regulator with XRE-family HTH domain
MPPIRDIDPESSPAAYFGGELRHLRIRAGITQEALAKILNYDPSYISAIELGKQFPDKRSFATAADETFGTDGHLSRAWGLVRNLNAIPAWMDRWLDIERESTVLRSWESQVVYGLLQTADYAFGLLRDEAAVRVRMARQEIFNREEPPPPAVFCMMDESVLWRPIGDKSVMYGQCLHLADMAEQRKAHVQIVRMGPHPGHYGSFTIATTETVGDEIAYVSTAVRGFTLSGRKDIAVVAASWEEIRCEAMSQQESIDLIRRAAEERWT